MSKRLTIEDYHAVAAKSGIVWIGEFPANSKEKTRWRCPLGHEWFACYNKIDQGRYCPKCSQEKVHARQRKPISEYQRIADLRGFLWVGSPVSTVFAKTEWVCAYGHRWLSSLKAIARGDGCPHCAGLAKKTLEDFHNLAASRGMKWLGNEVVNSNQVTTWECSCGAIRRSSYSNVSHGTLCRACGNKVVVSKLQLKEQAYISLAESRGFTWIGNRLPPNSGTKTKWRCQYGHVWEAPYAGISSGNGCSKCASFFNGARISKIQERLHRKIGGKLNHPFGVYNIDVALEVDGIFIAVEYDCYYWHRIFKDQRLAEQERDQKLISAGWRVLRIRSGEQLPTDQQINAAVSEIINGASFVEIVLDDWRES